MSRRSGCRFADKDMRQKSQEAAMMVESREALASLQDIAEVERRTREALVYSGSSTIFILWGVLVACGYGASTWQPGAARAIWLGVSLVGCAATALIVAARLRTRPRA